MSNNEHSSSRKGKGKIEPAHQACIDRAYRIPIFLSTTTHLNDKQQRFLNRLILEIENALLFPRTLPLSESYPESIFTDIRRLISSSYGMLAVNEGPPPSINSGLGRLSLFTSGTFNGFSI